MPVLLPKQSHRHLGLRMAPNGDFSAERGHVGREMRQRLEALAEDRVLSRNDKEVVIKAAVCSVLLSTGLELNWTVSPACGPEHTSRHGLSPEAWPII
jgi:hypothetical protein